MVPQLALPLMGVYADIAEVVTTAVREQLACTTYSQFNYACFMFKI